MITCKHQNKLLESLSKLVGCQTGFVLVSYGDMSYPQAACGWGSLMARLGELFHPAVESP